MVDPKSKEGHCFEDTCPAERFKKLKVYITQRGVHTHNRPYATLSQEERKGVLEDFLNIGSKKTREKWNISSATLHHVKWHNREVLEKIEDLNFQRIGL